VKTLIVPSVTPTAPNNCPALDNGQISIAATGANLEFSIDDGQSFQSSQNFTGLSAGDYIVQVRSGSFGCIIAHPDTIKILNTTCTEICNNNFDDDGDGLTDCDDPDCGLPSITSVTPTNPNNCPTLDNGSIAIVATGDNLEYSIDGGNNYQIEATFSNLEEGLYNVRVRNTVTGCFTDYANNPLSITDPTCIEICGNGQDDDGDMLADCDDPDCGAPNITTVVPEDPDNCPLLNNGKITINATGSNLEYSIDGGVTYVTTHEFINLADGNYDIKVKNTATGCVTSYGTSITLTDPSCIEICNDGIDNDGDNLTDCADPDCGQPAISDVASGNPDNCPDLDNGQITITATGDNLAYSINNGSTYHASNSFSNLSAGSYTIKVKNSGTDCTIDYTSNPVVIGTITCPEVCDNGIDDDGDRAIDYQDEDCGDSWPQIFTPDTDWLCAGTDYVFEVQAALVCINRYCFRHRSTYDSVYATYGYGCDISTSNFCCDCSYL